MRLGIEKVVALDLARFIDQNAQGFASAIQTVSQQRRKSGVQGVMFYALCHAADSSVGLSKNSPKKSPAGTACRGRTAMLGRPPRFARYAPSSLRPTRHRKTSRLRIYRSNVAILTRFRHNRADSIVLACHHPPTRSY